MVYPKGGTEAPGMNLSSVSLRATLFAMIAAVVVPLAVLLSLAGWYVDASLPEQAAFAPVHRALQMWLSFAVLVSLGAVVLAWFVARRLSRPVAGIMSAMQRAASGATDVTAPEGGPSEIALIGAEFNRMMGARARLEAERREALARAEAHERRLAEIIETIAEGVLILGPDGRYELANRAEEVLLGVPRDRILGVRYDEVSWRRAAADGSAFPLRDHPFERLQRGEPTVRNQVFQLITPQGRSRIASVNAAALRDAAGNFDGIVMTGVDITERTSAERRLADVIEALGEGLILIGPDGRYQLANRAEEELLGVTRDRIVGVRFDEVSWGRLAADGARFRLEDHPFARLARGEPAVRDFEMQVVTPQGRARTVLASAMPLHDAAGNFDGAVLTAVDITERKRIEQRLRDIIETMAEGLFFIDRDGRYELVNRAAEELLGTPREQAIGLRIEQAPWGRRAADGSAYRLEDHTFERLRRGEPYVRDREVQLVPANAPPRMVSINAMPLRDAAGNFDGIVATWVDITGRKSAERRLRDMIETMAEGLAIVGAGRALRALQPRRRGHDRISPRARPGRAVRRRAVAPDRRRRRPVPQRRSPVRAPRPRRRGRAARLRVQDRDGQGGGADGLDQRRGALRRRRQLRRRRVDVVRRHRPQGRRTAPARHHRDHGRSGHDHRRGRQLRARQSRGGGAARPVPGPHRRPPPGRRCRGRGSRWTDVRSGSTSCRSSACAAASRRCTATSSSSCSRKVRRGRSC